MPHRLGLILFIIGMSIPLLGIQWSLHKRSMAFIREFEGSVKNLLRMKKALRVLFLYMLSAGILSLMFGDWLSDSAFFVYAFLYPVVTWMFATFTMFILIMIRDLIGYVFRGLRQATLQLGCINCSGEEPAPHYDTQPEPYHDPRGRVYYLRWLQPIR